MFKMIGENIEEEEIAAKNLISGIFLQAIKDLKYEGKNKIRIKNKEEARKFLYSEGKYEGAVQQLCDMLDISYDCFIKGVKKLL